MPETNELSLWLEKHCPDPDGIKNLTVYGVKRKGPSEYSIFDGRVIKKGREYITTDLFRDARFHVRDLGDPFLINTDTYDLVSLLFVDKAAMDEYICQGQRADEFRSKTDKYCNGSTSWQLFAAMSVLENASELTCKVILNLIQEQLREDEKKRRFHAAELQVKKSRIEKYGRLMSGDTIDYVKEKIGIYAILEAWDVRFDDGVEMQVRICSGHGNAPLWTEARLSRNGIRLEDTSIEHAFPEKIKIMHGGETYEAEIVPV